MPVDRWNHDDKCGGEYNCVMHKFPDGDYVEYDDYEQLEIEITRYKALLKEIQNLVIGE